MICMCLISKRGHATDLTRDSGETDGGVQELVSDVSEDGSYVYFVATGVLAGGGAGAARITLFVA